MSHPCSPAVQTDESDFQSEVELLSQQCGEEGDHYACLRKLRTPKWNSLIMRFADQFKRYETDHNNYSLYVWGYFMPWIDYYRDNNTWMNSVSESTVYYNYYDSGKYPKFFQTNPEEGYSETIKFWIKKSANHSADVFTMAFDVPDDMGGEEVICKEMFSTDWCTELTQEKENGQWRILKK